MDERETLIRLVEEQTSETTRSDAYQIALTAFLKSAPDRKAEI